MTNYAGRTMLLKLGASGAGGTIAGVRVTSFTINNGQVDITNKDSSGWRTLLSSAGTRSVEISVNGVVDNGTTYETFQSNATGDTFATYQLVYGDADAIEATFQVSNFQATGGFDDEQTFQATLLSSGAITFTNA